MLKQGRSQKRLFHRFVPFTRLWERTGRLKHTQGHSALNMGKKSGFAKGVCVGFTYALLFCAWALLLWYAGILVRYHDTNGGKAFTTIINVIFSGFALGQAAPYLATIAKGRAATTNIRRCHLF